MFANWNDRLTRDPVFLPSKRSSTTVDTMLMQQPQQEQDTISAMTPSWQMTQPEENTTRILLRQTDSINNEKDSSAYPNSNAWTFYDYWISTLAISNVLILIVTTIFIAILFSNVKDSQIQNTENTNNTANHDDVMNHHLHASMTTKNNMFIIAETWITNAGTCKEWVDGNCARFIDQEPNPRLLEGILPNEIEKPSTGLFSSVNAPFLCLAAVVMSSAYSMCLLVVTRENNDDSYNNTTGSTADTHLTPKMLKSMSLLILVSYAILFLFIQRDWFLPFNNVLLVEFLFMISFLVINTFSVYQKHMYFGMRLLNTMFTSPLIAVSVLTMIGEDNSVNLILVYVSLVVSSLLILLANNEDAATTMNLSSQTSSNNTSKTNMNVTFFPITKPHFPGSMTRKGGEFFNNLNGRIRKVTNGWVENSSSNNNIRKQSTYSFIITFWICILPFLVECGLRFRYMTYESPIAYPSWSTACLALMFALYIMDGITWSFQYGFRGTFAFNVEDDTFSITSIFFKTLELIAKFVLVLLVIIGYYIEFRSAS